MKPTLALITILLSAGCMAEKIPQLASQVPQLASQIQPLRVGDTVPDVTLHTAEDTHFALREEVMTQPTVIIFYRGGWCPYCNRHLSALQTIEQQLLEMGFQILAISPDRPEKLRETAEKDNLTYQLLSDSSMEAARAFGIAFQLDDTTVKKYKEEYKIDIEADSGQTHHQLPVPAVFIADVEGKIIFGHTNPDYKVRLTPEAIITVARMLN
ncbi:MAG: AhpC/TSA family protein [Kiritimatiellales bacterium]|nr:AhpC/TSA family protein [Kiritimatiellota bacterium]MBL7012460.1 AhpC/TSA family protein [Kiritimatiellales bacterium]